MTIRRLAPLAFCLAAACCAAPSEERVPAPRQVALPQPTPPAPVPVAQPVYDDWMDAPRTPGDWSYRTVGANSVASYGEPGSEPRFALGCDRSARAVTLSRAAEAAAPVELRIRTETRDGTLTASPGSASLPTVATRLPASDPLLAAMAFSKGRFAIETPGAPTLYIPAWPEVTRVIEDCL